MDDNVYTPPCSLRSGRVKAARAFLGDGFHGVMASKLRVLGGALATAGGVCGLVMQPVDLRSAVPLLVTLASGVLAALLQLCTT